MSYMLEYRSTRVPLQELLKEFLYIFLINVRWSWLNRKCFKTTKYDSVHFTYTSHDNFVRMVDTSTEIF